MNRRDFILSTGGGAAGFALLHLRLQSAEAAQDGNRMVGQPFLFNQDTNDGNFLAPPGKAEQWSRDRISRTFAAGAGVFVSDVALPDVVVTKDTPTGEIYGARFSEEQRKEINGYSTMAELMAQGTDQLHLACEEGRKAGAIVLGGMRMSDAHHGDRWQAVSNDPLFGQFTMDHPEWCNTWEDGSRDATLNYAVPEVRAHRLQILREMATHYDIDGVELDWMRWCRHFPRGHQREYLDVLTEFNHQVRTMLDQVAREKGVERMILGHRVAVTVDECLNIGCDVQTWAQKGYADFLAPMDFLLTDLNTRTDEFVKAVEGTGCLVYPGFGQPRYSFDAMYKSISMRSLDMFRAAAHNSFAWGADGGSCFNMYLWPAEQQEFYTEAIAILSDPKKALAGPRHYIYLPVWKTHANGVGPTGRHNAQALTFRAGTMGKRQSFTFRMGDGRMGEKLRGTLRFRIYDATPGDEFAIDLNGVLITSEKLDVSYQPEGEAFWRPEWLVEDMPGVTIVGAISIPGEFTWPANMRFDIALQDCPAFRGDNELGITMVKQSPGSEKAPVMEALEVRVLG